MGRDDFIGICVVLAIAAMLIATGWAIGSGRATNATFNSPSMQVTTTDGHAVVTVNGRVIKAKDAERLVAFWAGVAEEARKAGQDG